VNKADMLFWTSIAQGAFGLTTNSNFIAASALFIWAIALAMAKND
jgi:hypothetical protein